MNYEDIDSVVFGWLLVPEEEREAVRQHIRDSVVVLLTKLVTSPALNKSARVLTYAFFDQVLGRGWETSVPPQLLLRKNLNAMREYDWFDGKVSEPWHLDGRVASFLGSGDARYTKAIVVEAQREGRWRKVADWCLNSVARRSKAFRAAAVENGWRSTLSEPCQCAGIENCPLAGEAIGVENLRDDNGVLIWRKLATPRRTTNHVRVGDYIVSDQKGDLYVLAEPAVSAAHAVEHAKSRLGRICAHTGEDFS